MNRLEWKEYFMYQAMSVSMRSTCDRRFVGAVIVDGKRIISTGYNGSLPHLEHCGHDNHKIRDGHCIRTIHAEQNALMQCSKYGIQVNGAAIFVTDFPCLICTKLLIASGIKQIFYYRDYRIDDFAMELIKKSGVDVEKVDIYDKLDDVSKRMKENLKPGE